MALFLNKTGRPIALSCEYAVYERGSFIKVGNALRSAFILLLLSMLLTCNRFAFVSFCYY